MLRGEVLSEILLARRHGQNERNGMHDIKDGFELRRQQRGFFPLYPSDICIQIHRLVGLILF
jgi:hypothetical protein